MSRWDPADDEVRDVRPYDFEGAKRAIARASRDQTEAEKWRVGAARDFAEKEEKYRIALATKILELHDAGVAWSSTADLARGDEKVARLRRERDIAEGIREAAEGNAWKCSANRKSLDRLVAWSMAVSPLGQEREPERLGRPMGAAA